MNAKKRNTVPTQSGTIRILQHFFAKHGFMCFLYSVFEKFCYSNLCIDCKTANMMYYNELSKDATNAY